MIEAVDRYTGLGARPDPETMCKGECEGLGFYPIMVPGHGSLRSTDEDRDAALIEQAEQDGRLRRVEDGWAWVTCETCGGKG